MEIMETADKIDLHLLHSFKVAITNQHVRDENSFSRLELTKGDTTKGSMITGDSGRIISGKKKRRSFFHKLSFPVDLQERNSGEPTGLIRFPEFRCHGSAMSVQAVYCRFNKASILDCKLDRSQY